MSYQEPPERDMVEHPPHYEGDGMQRWQAQRAALGLDGYVAHCRATAIKYCWRLGKKDLESQELRKAAWYLTKAAEQLEEQGR